MATRERSQGPTLPTTLAALPSPTQPSSAPPATRQTTPTTVATDERVPAARAGLAAWGRFAASGDLADLAGTFDESGPQYRQLAASASGVGGAPYTVTIDDAQVAAVDDHTTEVTVTAEWSRPDEVIQRYRWTIELRRTDTTWQVWTVLPGPG